MFIKTDAIENFSESLVRRDEEFVEELLSKNDNATKEIATRVSTIMVILSWYIYGKYAYFCIRGLIRHKNFNFLFPLAATLFAFVNNTNDIANYVYHQIDCYPFWLIFVGSATLNWAPISWLQAYRLILIAKIYLPKFTAFVISTLAIILSSIYCTFYFLNLSLFDYTKTDAIGCAVTNPGTWTPYIMVSDIADSVFSLASICVIVFKSINHLKELNTRNEKLNDLVGQGIIELFIIAIAKIVIYPLIHYTSAIPGLDVFWDVLSIIVIICAYKLVNFPYEQADNSKKGRHNIRKNIFNFIDSSIGHSSNEGSSNGSINNAKYIKTPDCKDTKSNKSRDTLVNPPSYSYHSMSNFCNYNGNFNGNYNGNYNKTDPNAYNASVKKQGHSNGNYNNNYNNANYNNANYNNANYNNANYNNANYNNAKYNKADSNAYNNRSYRQGQ